VLWECNGNHLKRLLDTDRSLGRSAKSADPEKATYAFFSQDAAGSGIEVRFQEYEAFALLTGWRFLVGTSHLLHDCLLRTPPSERGRPSKYK
jgi:hypothetical protein